MLPSSDGRKVATDVSRRKRGVRRRASGGVTGGVMRHFSKLRACQRAPMRPHSSENSRELGKDTRQQHRARAEGATHVHAARRQHDSTRQTSRVLASARKVPRRRNPPAKVYSTQTPTTRTLTTHVSPAIRLGARPIPTAVRGGGIHAAAPARHITVLRKREAPTGTSEGTTALQHPVSPPR